MSIWEGMFAQTVASSGHNFNLIGWFVFFLNAVIGAGAIFTLLTIKDLLEEQVKLLEAKQNK